MPEAKKKEQSEEQSKQDKKLERLLQAAMLANEARLKKNEKGNWTGEGDAVDVALLALGRKADLKREDLLKDYEELGRIPYESEQKFAASFHDIDGTPTAFVKGALDTVIEMCTKADKDKLKEQEHKLSSQQYRVLAFAAGKAGKKKSYEQKDLKDLEFLGLVGLRDPLREEASGAVDACHSAGVDVVMITGDHPDTAMAIARELKLSGEESEAVTGADIAGAESDEALDNKIKGAKVFARVEPRQKLDIIESLKRLGHFIAVTGDGVNDAPALKHAHVGVAMGKSGTDVAKESSDIIITDDNFASIVNGIEEGRVVYNNLRKIVFLLVATGLAEILIFFGAVSFNTVVPLFAAQLLWLNFVTNGIQDVALAFEPAEGNELDRPPRPPDEPIFNRLMIIRLALTAGVIGPVSFGMFYWLINNGYSDFEARNLIMLQLILFENVLALNSRSENLSFFSMPLLSNKFLLFGTIGAQLLHIGAMYTPWLSDVLQIQPVSFMQWSILLGIALSLMVVIEAEKYIRRNWISEKSGKKDKNDRQAEEIAQKVAEKIEPRLQEIVGNTTAEKEK